MDMLEGKKILTLIPARAGSKRLPWKNIKDLRGKPLIAWTIEQALGSKYADNVMVSTDDKGIAETAVKYGALAPFLRPQELAGDKASSIDVALHSLEWFKQENGCFPEFIILLQPTSPLRAAEDIDKAFEMILFDRNADAVVSITKALESPYSARVKNPKGFIERFINDGKNFYRKQDLPAVYMPNGAVYICRTQALFKEKTFYPEKTLGYEMPRERSVDIDDIIDFQFAQFLLEERVPVNEKI